MPCGFGPGLELRQLCLKGALHTFIEKEIISNTSSREGAVSKSQNKFKTLVETSLEMVQGQLWSKGP